jgi:hypothetical protein
MGGRVGAISGSEFNACISLNFWQKSANFDLSRALITVSHHQGTIRIFLLENLSLPSDGH